MDLFKRHLSLSILVAALFVQVVVLAYQVKRPSEQGPVRLIRVWGITLVTPAERAVVHVQSWLGGIWSNYFYLRDVRRENERLEDENTRLRLEQVRLAQDAAQAQRLQALMRFKEEFISQTVPAQVIGSSGSEQSRVLYLDKGSNDGVQPDMAVITPSGIVGKIIRVFSNTSQVLEISDQSSGVGVILEDSRLQGILKGTPAGQIMVHYIMGDQKVKKGEMVLTSGGDRVYPKGLRIGYVADATSGSDGFMNIRVSPLAPLGSVEEVLVITKIVEQDRNLIPEVPMRASEILAQRLPTVQPKLSEEAAAQAANPAPGTPQAATGAAAAKPAGTNPAKPVGAAKPAGSANGTAKPGTAPNGAAPVTRKQPANTNKPLTANQAGTPAKDKSQ